MLIRGPLLTPLLLLLPGTLLASMQPLDDHDLARVTGADGLSVLLESENGIQATELLWQLNGHAASTAADCDAPGGDLGCLRYQQPSLSGIGGPLRHQLSLDIGSQGSTAAVALNYQWQPQRFAISGLSLSAANSNPHAAGRSFGAMALDSQGSLALVNRGGLLNSAPEQANLDLSISGDLYYRQGPAGSAELSLADLYLHSRFSSGAASGQLAGLGSVGVDSQGLFLAAPHVDMGLGFDLAYKGTPDDFDQHGRSPLLSMQWQGGLSNARWSLAGGGASAGRQGLTLRSDWDFDSDFVWQIGEAGGDRNSATLSHWRRLGNANGPMLSMPISFDLLSAGITTGGLCAGPAASGSPAMGDCLSTGGEWFASDVASSDSALAILIRDGRLRAHAQQVRYRSAGVDSVYDWSLVYTFGKLDADLFLYPGGPSSNQTGLRSDITLLAQSPGYWQAANDPDPLVRAGAGASWENHSHFLLADTNVAGSGQQFGVGLLHSDVLWQVRDLYFHIGDQPGSYPGIPGGLWLHTDNQARYRFRGLLGGANLQDMGQTTALGLIDLNLDTDRFLFALSPLPADSNGNAPLGFNALFDLNDNSYFHFAEPANPGSAFRIDQLQGRIAWRDGKIGLRHNDGDAELYIENRLLLGASATVAGQPGDALIGTLNFGNEQFGRVVLPEGHWRSEVGIRIPGQ